MMARNHLVAVLVFVSLVAGGNASAQENGKTPEQEKTQPGEEYQIGPEDVLNIVVWKNEAISREVSVRPDGNISLPLVNDVKAAGLTPMQLRAVLLSRLVEYIPAPEVSVIVREVRSFKVSVIGEVTKVARYELRSRTSVLDALAMVGGFTQFASRSRIVILRPEGNTMKRIPFNYNKAAGGGEQENFFLQSGDIILVP